jgi:hypothetical protein
MKPDDVEARVDLCGMLIDAKRHVEVVQATQAAFQHNPNWAEDPRNYLRVQAARSALDCALGKGQNVPPPAERSAYRKQALDFLTAELAAYQKFPASEQPSVLRMMQKWLREVGWMPVRDAKALEALPPEERDAWNKFWVEVRELAARSAPPP